MNDETRAKETLERILKGIGDGSVTATDAEALIAQALRQAENDKLEEAARLMDRVMADSKAALIRTLKQED